MKCRDFWTESLSGLHCTNQYRSPDYLVHRLQIASNSCPQRTQIRIWYRVFLYCVRISRASPHHYNTQLTHREGGELTPTHNILTHVIHACTQIHVQTLIYIHAYTLTHTYIFTHFNNTYISTPNTQHHSHAHIHTNTHTQHLIKYQCTHIH